MLLCFFYAFFKVSGESFDRGDNMKDKTIQPDQRVEIPDGTMGTILNYVEKKKSYIVQLDSGVKEYFKPTEIKPISFLSSNSAVPKPERSPGGDDNW